MASSLSLAKTLFVPAAISLAIFVLFSFVVVPVWRRYRSRYGQYLPLDSLSEQTSSLRHRIVGRLTTLGPLATFLGGRAVALGPPSAADYDADGEELDEVDEHVWRALERHVPPAQPDGARRLSRDLEEGFMDDSDDDDLRPRRS